MMRRRARLHADKAKPEVAEQSQKPIAPDLAAKDWLAVAIDPVDLKDALRDVRTDSANLHVDGAFPLVARDCATMAHHDAVESGAVHFINLGR
jgi:hypothetical protein